MSVFCNFACIKARVRSVVHIILCRMYGKFVDGIDSKGAGGVS